MGTPKRAKTASNSEPTTRLSVWSIDGIRQCDGLRQSPSTRPRLITPDAPETSDVNLLQT